MRILLISFVSILSLRGVLGRFVGDLPTENPNANRPLPPLPTDDNNVSEVHNSQNDNEIVNDTKVEDLKPLLDEKLPVYNQTEDNNLLKTQSDVSDNNVEVSDKPDESDKKLPESYEKLIDSIVKKYLNKRLRGKLALLTNNPSSSSVKTPVHDSANKVEDSDFTTVETNKDSKDKDSIFGDEDLSKKSVTKSDNENYYERLNTSGPAASTRSTTPGMFDEPIYEGIHNDNSDLDSVSNSTYSNYSDVQDRPNLDEVDISLKDYLRSKKRGISRTYQRHVGSKLDNIKYKAANVVGGVKNTIGNGIYKTKYALGNAAYNTKAAVVNVARKTKNLVVNPARKVVRVATAPARKVRKIYKSFRTYPKDNIELTRYERDDIRDE